MQKARLRENPMTDAANRAIQLMFRIHSVQNCDIVSVKCLHTQKAVKKRERPVCAGVGELGRSAWKKIVNAPERLGRTFPEGAI
eukprot:1158370-Pelagomonas_calceolata.AAC.10